MQIISGVASGLPLEVPAGISVRPTPDRARKALFDSVGEWQGLTVYDLFAGSGAMGLEAASRGANCVRFVEENSRHCKFLRSNVERVRQRGVSAEMKVITASVTANAHWQDVPPNVVFADPPYAISGQAYMTLMSRPGFIRWMDSGILIWELPSEQHSCSEFMEFEIPYERSFRKYGNISYMFIRMGNR